jgi:phosphoglycerate dehydrogenase-like enzyme
MSLRGLGSSCRRSFRNCRSGRRESDEGIEEDLQEAEILFALSLRAEQLAAAPKLRWVHAPSTAVHEFLFADPVNSDVLVTNSREVHAPVVPEHVMALILALAKKIPQGCAAAAETPGGTLGLIGVGGIGCRVAGMAAAMGMRVIAVREHVGKGSPEGVEAVLAPATLDEKLQQSDSVVLAAPLVVATRGLIDAQRLAVMKAKRV